MFDHVIPKGAYLIKNKNQDMEIGQNLKMQWAAQTIESHR